jgi:hypothetical protein
MIHAVDAMMHAVGAETKSRFRYQARIALKTDNPAGHPFPLMLDCTVRFS